nr:hypothetical protein [uncultured Flavobacterium sp.]
MHIHDIAMHIYDIPMRIHDIAMHIYDSPMQFYDTAYTLNNKHASTSL